MKIPDYVEISLPEAPRAIAKGLALKNILNDKAIAYLARNISLVHNNFHAAKFYRLGMENLDAMTLMERARHIARALFETLPGNYAQSINILINSMPPENQDSEEFGLAGLFYLPYSCYIAQYGLSDAFNDGCDPFDTSMRAQLALTKRFSAEFSIRPFLVAEQERTLAVIHSWLADSSNHVRRLCSEGTRPRLPWGINLSAFIKDPRPIIPILEALKNDPSLYVRRSVANNLGDIAKDHPDLVFDLCSQWLEHADDHLKWLIRHAVRYHAKKKHPTALQLRVRAKSLRNH